MDVVVRASMVWSGGWRVSGRWLGVDVGSFWGLECSPPCVVFRWQEWPRWQSVEKLDGEEGGEVGEGGGEYV